MTALTDQEFVSGTTITSEWLNGVNDALNDVTSAINSGIKRTLTKRSLEYFSVKDFGALGDGINNDTPAIESALTYLNSVGGGILYFPSGTYLVNKGTEDAAILIQTNNIHIVGAGVGNTEIKLNASQTSHLVSIKNCYYTSISGITLNGNRDNQSVTSGFHALRISGVDTCLVNNMLIKNAVHYGIGGMSNSVKRFIISNTHIQDTGGDGIDFKNPDLTQEATFINNVSVKRWFLSSSLSNQKGIDLRGPVEVNNVRIDEPYATSCIGLHFNIGPSGAGSLESMGAKYSVISNVNINMGDPILGSRIGIQVEAPNCCATNVQIYGGYRGILVADTNFKLSTSQIRSAYNDGVLVDTAAVNTTITSVSCTSNGNRGINILGDYTNLIGCNCISNTAQGIGVDSSATSTNIIGGRIDSNGSTDLGNGGTNLSITNLIGFVSKVAMKSSVSVTTTGVKTVSFTHGLGRTPTIENVTASLIRESLVDDYIIGWLRVDLATSTTITVRFNVTTASATGGSTVLIGIKAEV